MGEEDWRGAQTGVPLEVWGQRLGKRERSKGVSATKGTFTWKRCLSANSPWSSVGSWVPEESRLQRNEVEVLETDGVPMRGRTRGSPPWELALAVINLFLICPRNALPGGKMGSWV